MLFLRLVTGYYLLLSHDIYRFPARLSVAVVGVQSANPCLLDRNAVERPGGESRVAPGTARHDGDERR